MTATPPNMTTTTCPPPSWTTLRDNAPDVLDDLTDAWARIETLIESADGDTLGRLVDLRRVIEHLGESVEATVAELIAAWDEIEELHDDRRDRYRRLARVHAGTVVACDHCTTESQVEAVAMAGRCWTLGCPSTTFEGWSLDELAGRVSG